ncbi:MAG: hypothetical protein HY072_00155 [Deltaproteobacteria bacterium]|nr:hypothetical protein [Deltaproteobacteria bacterium]
MSYGTKHIGLVLIPTFFVYEVLRTKKFPLLSCFAMLVFFVFALIQQKWIPTRSFESQMPYFRLDLSLILSNLRMYLGQPSVFFENGYWILGRQILFVIFSLFALSGLSRKSNLFSKTLWRSVSIYEIFAFLFLIPLLLWPYNQGIRFLLPLMPLFFLYVFHGARESGRYMSVFLLIVLVISYSINLTSSYFGPWNQMDNPLTTDVFDFVKQNTDPKDVLIFDRPAFSGFFTKRNSSIAFISKNDDEMFDYMRSIHAKYLIITEFIPELKDHMLGVVQRNKGMFNLVYSNPAYKIFIIQLNSAHGI